VFQFDIQQAEVNSSHNVKSKRKKHIFQNSTTTGIPACRFFWASRVFCFSFYICLVPCGRL